MTTTVLEQQQNCIGKDSIYDNEMATWKRIVQLRIQDSEDSNLTLSLLKQYGCEGISETDNSEDPVTFRQLKLRQILFHHIGIMTNQSAVNRDLPTVQQRLTSWKVLQDIFNTIDKGKETRGTNAVSMQVVPTTVNNNTPEASIHMTTTEDKADEKNKKGKKSATLKELPKKMNGDVIASSPSVPRKRKRQVAGESIPIVVPTDKKRLQETTKKSNKSNTMKKVAPRTTKNLVVAAGSKEQSIQQQENQDLPDCNQQHVSTTPTENQTNAGPRGTEADDTERPIQKKQRPLARGDNNQQPKLTSLLTLCTPLPVEKTDATKPKKPSVKSKLQQLVTAKTSDKLNNPDQSNVTLIPKGDKIYTLSRSKQVVSTKASSSRPNDSAMLSFTVERYATCLLGKVGQPHKSILITNPITFTVQADNKVGMGSFAKTYEPRFESCDVQFICTEIQLHQVKEIGRRLQEWDPFWKVKMIEYAGVTHTIQSVTPQTNKINTAMQHYLASNVGYKYPLKQAAEGKATTGDLILQLKMLPETYSSATMKRADCHLWPKGTFLQINGVPRKIEQRRQNPPPFDKKWKEMCEPLCVNKLLNDGSELNCIQMCCADDTKYYYALSLAEYRDSGTLFSLLLDPNSNERLTKLSYESSLAKARMFASQQMSISLDSDEEMMKDNTNEMGKFVFSLTCPISRTLIVTPVRGKQCKHFQCFDLRNYIDTNTKASGNRWRCASCEMFISIQNLEVCGLTSYILKQYKDVANSERDRIELYSNGQYNLLRQQVSRHRKVLNATSSTGPSTIAVNDENVEVID